MRCPGLPNIFMGAGGTKKQEAARSSPWQLCGSELHIKFLGALAGELAAKVMGSWKLMQ